MSTMCIPEIAKNQLEILGSSISADAGIPETKTLMDQNFPRITLVLPPTDDASDYVDIPNNIHFIWVGNPIPEKYKKNIANWNRMQPYHRVHLWVDSDLLTKSEFAEIKKFCDDNNITLVDVVTKIKDPTNKTWANRDYGMYYDNVIGENRNWGIASNFLRALILLEMGGIYLDVDIYRRDRLPEILKVPKFGLALEAMLPPIEDDVVEDDEELLADEEASALCDSMMISTQDNRVIAEFLRLMQEKYNERLRSNEAVLTMRSRILSNIVWPTYKIVGPEVLAEAFVNVEKQTIPFRSYFNQQQLSKTLINRAFNDMVEFFPNHFGNGLDDTWTNTMNEEAQKQYETLLSKFSTNLLYFLNKEHSAGTLDETFEKIRQILSAKEKTTVKLEHLRNLLQEDTKLWSEIYNYFRPNYIATLITNETISVNNVDSLYFKEDWPAYFALIERLHKDTLFLDSLEEPRQFGIPVLNRAAKNQNKLIAKAIIAHRSYRFSTDGDSASWDSKKQDISKAIFGILKRTPEFYLKRKSSEPDDEKPVTQGLTKDASTQPLVSFQYVTLTSRDISTVDTDKALSDVDKIIDGSKTPPKESCGS